MAAASALKVLMLAHDLSDAAIEKRLLMLKAGGADVKIAGFRRTPQPIAKVGGSSAVDLGQTYSAGFIQRIWSVLREVLQLHRHRDVFSDVDVIISRNLEMLALAVRGRNFGVSSPIIVYECLDIHRLLLRRDIIGEVLRGLEGWLSTRASALVTSSQAFVDGYFNTLSRVRLPIRIVENKVLLLDKEAPRENIERPAGPPWIIGWFGIIRCRKSFEVLRNLVWQGHGRVRVIIRGKPALNEIPDFHDIIEKTPGLSFDGPYKNPGDLAAMYQNVHFTWAIDMFEEGLNSVWLLPNRLYEGGLYGSVPIALENVETGHFLKKLGAGVLVREPLNNFLLGFFKDLADADYKKLEATGAEIPQTTWVYSREDCRAFVNYLAGLRHENIAGGKA